MPTHDKVNKEIAFKCFATLNTLRVQRTSSSLFCCKLLQLDKCTNPLSFEQSWWWWWWFTQHPNHPTKCNFVPLWQMDFVANLFCELYMRYRWHREYSYRTPGMQCYLKFVVNNCPCRSQPPHFFSAFIVCIWVCLSAARIQIIYLLYSLPR